jgi:hypothetical protein
MSILSSSRPGLNFHVLLEKSEAGRTIASIAELANCRVEADSRKEALVAIQELVSDRLRTCLKSFETAYPALVLGSNRRTIKCTIAP